MFKVIKRFTFPILLLLVLSSTGCGKHVPDPETGFALVEILVNDHRSRPYELIWKNDNKISQTWYFDTNCAYEHGDENQKDWNKLTGLAWDAFSNHVNSAMVGWRWDPDLDLMNLNAYYHVDGQRTFTQTLISVDLEEHFTIAICKINDNQVDITITDSEGVTVSHSQEFPAGLQDRSRVIWTWFGGTYPANHYMTLRFFNLN